MEQIKFLKFTLASMLILLIVSSCSSNNSSNDTSPELTITAPSEQNSSASEQNRVQETTILPSSTSNEVSQDPSRAVHSEVTADVTNVGNLSENTNDQNFREQINPSEQNQIARSEPSPSALIESHTSETETISPVSQTTSGQTQGNHESTPQEPVTTSVTPSARLVQNSEGIKNSLAVFGYHGKTEADIRPVIVVPIAFADEPIDVNVEDTIYKEIFGPKPDGFTTQNFIQKISNGNAGISSVALLPTITATQRRSENTSDLERGKAIEQIVNSGIDLKRYDKDGNGVITEREVIIVSVVADPIGVGGGGAVRSYCGHHRSQNGLIENDFCGATASFSEHVGFGTITHEILHLFGAPDMYSIVESGLHVGMTIMTVGTPKAYPNPYFRMKNGWVPPQPIDLAQIRRAANLILAEPSASCFRLRPLGHINASMNKDYAPLLLYDSASPNGTREYLMGELRMRTGMDLELYDEGFAFFYAKENESGIAERVTFAMRRREADTVLPTPVGDDIPILSWRDGRPILITPGLNGVLDTPFHDTQDLVSSNSVILYSAPHLAANLTTGTPNDSCMGFPKLWKDSENPIMKIVWPDVARLNGGPRDSGMAVRFGPLPSMENLQSDIYASIEVGTYDNLRQRHEMGLSICQGLSAK